MGTIRKLTDKGPSDPFIARAWMQVYDIRDNAFSDREERFRFDQAYEPIRRNLEQCLAARDDVETLWNNYRTEVLSGAIVRRDEEILHIDKSIDIELERKNKEFFNRGKNALDLLDRLNSWIGISPSQFNKSKKEFVAAKQKLLASAASVDRQRYESIIDFIENQRVAWLTDFTKIRIDIEHTGWHLPQVEFAQLPDGRIAPIMPKIGGNNLDIVLNIYWMRILEYCEIIVVLFALGRYIKYPRVLVEIPPESRDPARPARFAITVDMK